ncbi:MAG TPA: 23S rRNA (adenine(2503)-C(2))-methyltransferase RlmN [Anaerolineae bacterium]|nr:23S rRNA (adenine(2503)-C(2))-methyltransferase RlmN [Anaerolineae bacterium]HQH39530.1 23S rRNA (adenine(2503)-C(2))-methyltransferase RlmN [Anaerolineae bacterium]
MAKPNLYDLDLPALEALLGTWGEPRYRAKQIWEWLYRHLVVDIEQMTSLPKALRERLAAETRLSVPRVLARRESIDGETRKDLLALDDGQSIEVVLMRYIERRSACISTQVGCAVGCRFCATGQMGIRRNLTRGEIVAQVLHLMRELDLQDQRLTHVVLMGMGEPFLNYDNTLAAIRTLIHPDGLQIGQRRITLSTAGVAPGIRRFADEGLQVNLAVSLHAATDALRSELMPINRRYGLNELFSAVNVYLTQTNRRVTFEWVLIDGVNDTVEQAEALAARSAGMLVHVNLIPLNPTAGYAGQPSSAERSEAFTQILERRHVPFTLRLRRGIDIQAGCGQLRAQTANTVLSTD